eukprot:3220145-Alexandrium_andersonii.AAC.1
MPLSALGLLTTRCFARGTPQLGARGPCQEDPALRAEQQSDGRGDAAVNEVLQVGELRGHLVAEHALDG